MGKKNPWEGKGDFEKLFSSFRSTMLFLFCFISAYSLSTSFRVLLLEGAGYGDLLIILHNQKCEAPELVIDYKYCYNMSGLGKKKLSKMLFVSTFGDALLGNVGEKSFLLEEDLEPVHKHEYEYE